MLEPAHPPDCCFLHAGCGWKRCIRVRPSLVDLVELVSLDAVNIVLMAKQPLAVAPEAQVYHKQRYLGHEHGAEVTGIQHGHTASVTCPAQPLS